MRTPQDIVTYYETGQHAPHLSKLDLMGSYEITAAELVDVPPGRYPDPPVDGTFLQLVDAPAQARYDMGSGPVTHMVRRGAFLLSPVKTACDYQIDNHFSMRTLMIPTAALRATGMFADGETPHFGALHERAMRDPLIEHLICGIFAVGGKGLPSDALFVDCAIDMLILSLARLQKRIPQYRKPVEPLDAERLSSAIEMMEDRLDDTVTLDDLANAAGMDRTTFLKAFRSATGMPPYQFLLHRRLARAQAMLRTGTLGIAEVAYACGFSSQQHMTNIFSAKLGVTPGRYRANGA